MDLTLLAQRGWLRLPASSGTQEWAEAARAAGRDVLADPEMRATWLQCEGTWFVGVDALPTGPDGALGAVPIGVDVAALLAPHLPLHRAQMSVVFPGYPRPGVGESAGAFRYRRDRDAAHVDGIIAEGPERRRRIREPHALIVGLPLTDVSGGASPLVVWEGSPAVMRAGLADALASHPERAWGEADVTETYGAARRRCFETCPRVPLEAAPGETILLHRLALHGIAPWAKGAAAPADGRMIAYFRPPMPGGVPAWLAE